MPLVDPLEQSRQARKQRGVATARTHTHRHSVETADSITPISRKCTFHGCKGDMVVAASRGNRVMVCMSCRSALPVVADWQLVRDTPPPQEQAGTPDGSVTVSYTHLTLPTICRV